MADWFGDSGFTLPDVDYGSSFEMPSGQDWMGGFNFQSPDAWGMDWSGINLDPQTGWTGQWQVPDFSGNTGSSWDWGNLDTWGKAGKNISNAFGPIGDIAKAGFGAWQAIDRSQQMADYNKAIQDYYTKRQASEADYNKAFSDYLGRRAAWEEGLAGAMGEAGAGVGEAMGEFQSQMAGWQEKLGEAMGSAKDVMGRFIAAANPLLGQSQDLLVPGIAALARGEEPEAWQPILNEMRQKGTAVGMQALVSAGMSPEAARAAVLPKVTQDAQSMLMQLATQMVTQGVAVGAQGMTGLQGAGQLASIMGNIGAQGAQVGVQSMSPVMAQYQAMLQAMSGLFGGGFPPMPGGASTPPPMPAG